LERVRKEQIIENLRHGGCNCTAAAVQACERFSSDRGHDPKKTLSSLQSGNIPFSKICVHQHFSSAFVPAFQEGALGREKMVIFKSLNWRTGVRLTSTAGSPGKATFPVKDPFRF